MNVREEDLKERRLRELQIQEDKTMGIWAKKQLRIEQQIATKQSPLQRARRIRIKRQEEINRIHMHSSNDYKTCEKRLSKRANSCGERRLERISENYDIERSSSSISLPIVPANNNQTHSKRNSLPTLSYNPKPMAYKRSSLPSIESQLPIKTCHKINQSLYQQKLPPLKV